MIKFDPTVCFSQIKSKVEGSGICIFMLYLIAEIYSTAEWDANSIVSIRTLKYLLIQVAIMLLFANNYCRNDCKISKHCFFSPQGITPIRTF